MSFIQKPPIAHRGLHDQSLPENSLSAFSAALDHGYAIETDVRFTKDKKLVLFHDDSLLRMTGENRKVFECTFTELGALRLKDSKESIPLLSQLLTLNAGRVPILLEIKNQPEVETKEFLGAIKEEFSDYHGEYAVQSFQPLYVRAYKKLCPNVPCGLLTYANPDWKEFSPPFAKIKRHIVANMSLNFWIKPDFISFEFHSPTKKAKTFKGGKLCWTVRSIAEEQCARKLADNIIFENFLPQI